MYNQTYEEYLKKIDYLREDYEIMLGTDGIRWPECYDKAVAKFPIHYEEEEYNAALNNLNRYITEAEHNYDPEDGVMYNIRIGILKEKLYLE